MAEVRSKLEAESSLTGSLQARLDTKSDLADSLQTDLTEARSKLGAGSSVADEDSNARRKIL